MGRRSLVALVLCLAAYGCGLKVPYDPGAAKLTSGASGQAAGGDEAAATGDGLTGAEGGAAGAAGGAAAGAAATTKGTADKATVAAASCSKPGLFPNECEGVTNKQITVCSHIPITGAAPIPRDPRRFGAFYFDYVNKELGGVNGRQVRWLVYDDQYYPAGAQAAFEKCRSQGTFVFLGTAGTDQIVAVSKRANQLKLPYLHGPASIKDIGGQPFSKFIGPDYEAQHRLLADYVVKNAQTMTGKANPRIGMVRVDSPFFDAGRDAFADQLTKKGATLVVDRKVQKDESSFGTLMAEFANQNVDVINNFTTPTIWLKMLKQAPPNYQPTYVAVAPVAGYNLIAQALTDARAKAYVFSVFNPAYNEEDRGVAWDPAVQDFIKIFGKYSPEQNPPRDDFDFSAYLAAKLIHKMLQDLGPDPTRSKLWAYLEGLKQGFDPKANPLCPLDFTSNAHVGARAVNVFKLGTARWEQVATCIDKA